MIKKPHIITFAAVLLAFAFLMSFLPVIKNYAWLVWLLSLVPIAYAECNKRVFMQFLPYASVLLVFLVPFKFTLGFPPFMRLLILFSLVFGIVTVFAAVVHRWVRTDTAV